MINHQIIKSLGQHNNECGYCVATLPMHQENQNANTYAAILAAMHKYELPTVKIAENKQYHMASNKEHRTQAQSHVSKHEWKLRAYRKRSGSARPKLHWHSDGRSLPDTLAIKTLHTQLRSRTPHMLRLAIHKALFH